MVAEIRIYFEGDPALKPGFHKFFEGLRKSAWEKRCKIQFVSGKGGGDAERDFGIALKRHTDSWNILLIDSEGPLMADAAEALCRRHNWDRAHAGSVFWMVQMMEAWFFADKEKVAEFYGPGFRAAAMAQNRNVEQISKADLINGLKAATRDLGKSYHKTSHPPKLLEIIRPPLVRNAAPNCDRLFRAVEARLE